MPLVSPLRVAILCDFAEEKWPSMDLVGDMLFQHLQQREDIAASQLRPRMQLSRFSHTRPVRLFARFAHYPRLLRSMRSDYDVFHIVDHSYSHLVHELPAHRTIVTCHDLDAFRSLLDPVTERRSGPFRAMMRRVLRGMQAAAHVICDSAATRDNILHHRLIPADRITVVHNGVHPAFSPVSDPLHDEQLNRLLGRQPNLCPELLHVGSTIPRKRIDVLLRVFAAARRHHPGLRLIRLGPDFNSQQRKLAKELRVESFIDHLSQLNVHTLSACYRRASLLLQPSDAEGFGLPVVEAMACGTPVIASDIPALREVGGDAAAFCPVADVEQWASTLLDMLHALDSSRLLFSQRAIQNAARFSWRNHAQQMTDIYSRVTAS
jgi:glycosyltransferase involved in cell wall biosynthesis